MMRDWLFLMIAATGLHAAEFHVSPSGSDAGDGSAHAPFATPARATAAVRELRKAKPDLAEPVNVYFSGGFYPLEKTWALGPEDSGTEKSPTYFEAAANERPVISGGVRITGWKIGADGRWRVTLPEVAAGKWNFGQLFVNDQRRMRPRLPESGYYAIERQLKPTAKNEKIGFDQMGFTAGEIHADWANLRDVEMIAFHKWTISRLRTESVDMQTHTAVFTGPTRGLAEWMTLKKGNRYFLENVKEALGRPGQWYLDRPTGELTYIPMPGETPEKSVVIAPRVETLLAIGASRLGFERITFAHANWALAEKGQSYPQAEIQLGAAVDLENARQVTLQECAVRNVGQYAISFGPGCQNDWVIGCDLVDLGGGGIQIGSAGGPNSWEGRRLLPPSDDQLTRGIVVLHNTIAHAGRLHPAAVGVWIGHSPDNVIEHNDIFDLYYTAVSVGWVWGYGPSKAVNNTIAWNHLYNLGQNVLSDMGGVYTLGISPGTTVHHNYIHEVDAHDYGAWGLYTDEGSTGIVMSHNVVWGVEDGAFHQHYGRDNLITQNILAHGSVCQVRRSPRKDKHTTFTFKQNIVYFDQGTLLGMKNSWKQSTAESGFTMDRNLYFDASGRPIDFDGKTLDQWHAMGQDKQSIIADPMFVDPRNPRNHDFHLKAGSPAEKIGFEPWDYTQAGRRSKSKLTADLPAVPRTFE